MKNYKEDFINWSGFSELEMNFDCTFSLIPEGKSKLLFPEMIEIGTAIYTSHRGPVIVQNYGIFDVRKISMKQEYIIGLNDSIG